MKLIYQYLRTYYYKSGSEQFFLYKSYSFDLFSTLLKIPPRIIKINYHKMHNFIFMPLLLFLFTTAIGHEYSYGQSARNKLSSFEKWLEGDYMTGTWNGFRTKLNHRGINPFGYYNATFLGNPAGGISRGFEYAGLITARLSFDLERILNLNGLKFTVSGSRVSGKSLTNDHIGNIFNVSQVFNFSSDSGFNANSLRLFQFFLEQSLFENKLNIAVGRMGTGDEFATSHIYGYYVNVAFNGNPGSIIINLPTFTSDPFATWGTRLKLKLKDNLYFKTGIYNADPDIVNINNNGLNFSLNGGVLIIGEAGYHKKSRIFNKDLPGNFKIGAYLDTGEFEDLNNPENSRSDNYGFYLLSDQMFYRENSFDNQGLLIFSVFTLAPQKEINTFPFFFSNGIQYRGLIPNRNHDVVVFGLAYGNFSSDLAGQDFEMIIELTYALQLTNWFLIQPDFQYVIHPNGDQNINNAFVLGMQLQVEL